MITQRDFMKQDILLKQKIGLRLSRAGHLSKLFATSLSLRKIILFILAWLSALNGLAIALALCRQSAFLSLELSFFQLVCENLPQTWTGFRFKEG